VNAIVKVQLPTNRESYWGYHLTVVIELFKVAGTTYTPNKY